MAEEVPSLQKLQQYVVNGTGWEAITQSMFDSAAYPTAGITSLPFFSTPVGQGVGLGGGAKTYSDTNMQLGGMMPAQQAFLVQGIEVAIFTSTPTVAATMPAAFGAQAVAAGVNDAYIIGRSGNLNFTIGSKPYCQDGPLMKFPPSASFEIDAALSDITTAGAAMQSRIAFAKSRGRPYSLGGAQALLTANQNFSVTLAWPEGLQAVTSAAWIKVSLFGLLYRRMQ